MKLKKQFRVTGLSQFDYNIRRNSIGTGMSLTIKPQPENKYDSNAIGVYFDYGGHTTAIGWIPKAENPPVSKVFKDTNLAHRAVRVVKHEPKTPLHESTLIIEAVFDYATAQLNPARLPALCEYFLAQGFEITESPLGHSVKHNPCAEISIAGHAADAFVYGSTTANMTSTGMVNIAASKGSVASFGHDNIELNGSITLSDAARSSLKAQLNKDNKMTKILDTNKSVATQAAFQEAGRIFLNQITKVAAKQAPMMLRGYVETPAGKLAIANAAVFAVQHFRPTDAKLNRLANAALAQAYLEVYKTFDIEALIDGFLDNDTIKRALTAAGDNDE